MKHMTRKEIFMAALAKGVKAPIKPLTREEQLLAAHAEREASGGGGYGDVTGTFDINATPTINEYGEESCTIDKTRDEIAEAFNSGSTIRIIFNEYDFKQHVMPLIEVTYTFDENNNKCLMCLFFLSALDGTKRFAIEIDFYSTDYIHFHRRHEFDGTWTSIQDKPFGEEWITETVTEPEQLIFSDTVTTEFNGRLNSNSEDGAQFSEKLTTLYNQLYKVVLNGEVYSDLQGYWYETDDGEEYLVVGNDSVPFMLYRDDDRYLRGRIGTLYGERYSVEIYKQANEHETETEVIWTLDSKYLPKATAVDDVTDAPTAEDFNTLLAALREAGYLTT